MTIKDNNRDNGYIIALTGEGSKHKEIVILKAIRKCLREHPGKNISVVLTDDKILINTDKNQSIQEVNTTSKHRK